MKKVLLLLLQISAAYSIFAQRTENGKPISFHSPDGIFDTVFDGFGNKYTLKDISIYNALRNGTATYKNPLDEQRLNRTTSGCTSGYFQVYFEPGCGMDGSGHPDMDYRNVLCQVLNDISQFLPSPCTGTGQKVNIWVRTSTTGVLGVGSPFYNIPYCATDSGITDNTAWITINSGTDAFKNISSPLVTSGGGSSGSIYFHGSIRFNFGGTIKWHTNLATAPGSGETDLYTVALHEMMHVLGFGSLIDHNGISVIGSKYPFYTRYDTHLQTPAGANLITQPAGYLGCDLYQYGFNTSLAPFSVLSPGSTSITCPSGYQTGSLADHTNCSDANKYVDGTMSQPVYTPACFEKGSSLSHFEDECLVPASFSSTHTSLSSFNNQYFLLSNAGTIGPYNSATNPAAMKRYLRPEERQVLCDIGYKVNTNFGSSADLNNINYGGTVCGESVAGICDGINKGGTYAFITGAGTPININGSPLKTSLLDNDYNAVSFKYLEVVQGAGVLSATSGTKLTNISFTPATGAHGVQLLRYIPVSASGKEGNITYVYVYVSDGNCAPSACNLVYNGGFEEINVLPTNFGGIHCWSTYIGSPDLYARGNSAGWPYVPFNGVDVHPLSTGTNNNFVGFADEMNSPGDYFVESFNQSLSSPLIPGQSYLLSFWLRYNDTYVGAGLDTNHLLFAVSTTKPLVALGGTTIPGMPVGLITLADFKITYPGQRWTYYSQTVAYTDSIANSLVILGAPWLQSFSPTTGHGDYLWIDDISIIPAPSAGIFKLPDVMCVGEKPFDLNTCVASFPGGTFSWQTIPVAHSGLPVATVSHSATFNPSDAYAASEALNDTGSVIVGYTYSDGLGCQQTVYSSGKILPANKCTLSSPVIPIQNVNIWPNPTYNNVTIENANNCLISIRNMLGQQVLEFTIVSNVQTIDLRNLQKGIYFVEIQSLDGFRKEVKLIKE